MMSIQAILAIGFVALFVGQAYGEGKVVKFKDCDSIFTIKEVRVDPCPNNDGTRCPLKRGTTPRVSVVFTPNKEVRNLTATVHGIVASIPTEFPLPNRNGCLNSGLTCPLVPGQEYTYTQTVPVLESYPDMGLLIRWALDSDTSPPPAEGEKKKHDVCFVIRAQVTG